jgi:hypothetical protein
MRFLASSFVYLLLLIPSLIIVASLWGALVSGRLYYCWDSTPLVDFVPPFVHSDIDIRDHYIASPWLVWSLWSLFFASALILPLALVPSVRRRLE